MDISMEDSLSANCQIKSCTYTCFYLCTLFCPIALPNLELSFGDKWHVPASITVSAPPTIHFRNTSTPPRGHPPLHQMGLLVLIVITNVDGDEPFLGDQTIFLRPKLVLVLGSLN